jgi:hypothetical protein
MRQSAQDEGGEVTTASDGTEVVEGREQERFGIKKLSDQIFNHLESFRIQGTPMF